MTNAAKKKPVEALIELIGSKPAIGEELQKRERAHRIRDVVDLARQNGLELTDQEAEEFVGAVERSKAVSNFLDEFGSSSSSEAFRRLSQVLYP